MGEGWISGEGPEEGGGGRREGELSVSVSLTSNIQFIKIATWLYALQPSLSYNMSSAPSNFH